MFRRFSTTISRELSKCYQTLELPVNQRQDLKTVKEQYLRLAQKYHPDHFKQSAQKFIEIKDAYEKLVELEHQYQQDPL